MNQELKYAITINERSCLISFGRVKDFNASTFLRSWANPLLENLLPKTSISGTENVHLDRLMVNQFSSIVSLGHHAVIYCVISQFYHKL